MSLGWEDRLRIDWYWIFRHGKVATIKLLLKLRLFLVTILAQHLELIRISEIIVSTSKILCEETTPWLWGIWLPWSLALSFDELNLRSAWCSLSILLIHFHLWRLLNIWLGIWNLFWITRYSINWLFLTRRCCPWFWGVFYSGGFIQVN